jgi:predicted acylesterase/phospholipase RssA
LNPLHYLSVILLGLALAACAGPTVESLRDPVPELLVTQSAVPGYKRIRYWGDNGDGLSPDIVAEIAAQQKAAGNASEKRNFLAVSGGGSNGAFGAGLLFGWTASGKRPEFAVVTGVSTGSLIAPFAFLGPPYDDSLKEAYTQVSAEDIFEKKGVFRVLRGAASVADSSPLRRLVARYVTDQMLADITREHKRGRRLLVGTTNLDAERPVVWDIGAIASSGVAGRKQLIQDILVASASVPGLFPPVKIKVVADGMTFDEMHVDGGTSNQAFMFPSNFSVRQTDKKLNRAGVDRTLYVVRNGKVTPEFSKVTPRLAAIVSKSMNSLIKTQGIGDLYRMYSNSQREGIAFRAVWIPESFTMKEPELFDPDFMRALFDLGYEMGRTGIPWAEQPP